MAAEVKRGCRMVTGKPQSGHREAQRGLERLQNSDRKVTERSKRIQSENRDVTERLKTAQICTVYNILQMLAFSG
jgi:hypothetical protein